MMGGWQTHPARRSRGARFSSVPVVSAPLRCCPLTGCSYFSSDEPPAPTVVLTPAALDPINGLIATTRLHLLRLDAAIAADPADAARLTPLRDDRQAQLTALEAEFARIEPGQHGRRQRAAAPTTGGGHHARHAGGDHLGGSRRRSHGAGAVHRRDVLRLALPGGDVRLDRRVRWPAIGRCWHDESRPEPRPADAVRRSVASGRRVRARRPCSVAVPTTAPAGPLAPDAQAALQAALAAEQAAVWAYGLVAAYARDQAAMIAEARSGHLLRRDATTARIIQGGAAAPEPAAAYQVSVAVTDSASALAAGPGHRNGRRSRLAGGHRIDRRRRAARVRVDRPLRCRGPAGHVETGRRRPSPTTMPVPRPSWSDRQQESGAVVSA